MAADPLEYESLLKDAPTNWGRWGPDDELGALNLLDAPAVLDAVRCIRTGKVFTLGLQMASPTGDPVWPHRTPARRFNVHDRGTYLAGKDQAAIGGMEYADDLMVAHPQGTTHVDGLAHTWFAGRTYNGYPAESTIGGLAKASAEPIAAHGIVGRGVLVDLARARGVPNLAAHDGFGLPELCEVAEEEGVEIRPRDILLIRTGWIEMFYREGPEAFYGHPHHEPGMLFDESVPRWFRDLDIVGYATDTIGNEFTVQPATQLDSPLHASLMRNLGVAFMEMLRLDALAADCAADGQWDFLFAGSPLRIVAGTGAPMNPLAIK